MPQLNLWVRTAPRGAEEFCWHVDIVPRLTIRGRLRARHGGRDQRLRARAGGRRTCARRSADARAASHRERALPVLAARRSPARPPAGRRSDAAVPCSAARSTGCAPGRGASCRMPALRSARHQVSDRSRARSCVPAVEALIAARGRRSRSCERRLRRRATTPSALGRCGLPRGPRSRDRLRARSRRSRAPLRLGWRPPTASPPARLRGALHRRRSSPRWHRPRDAAASRAVIMDCEGADGELADPERGPVAAPARRRWSSFTPAIDAASGVAVAAPARAEPRASRSPSHECAGASQLDAGNAAPVRGLRRIDAELILVAAFR